MTQSESIKQLSAALASAQKLIKVAAKEAVNPHFKSKYADLAEVFNACRQGLQEFGIAVIQAPGYEAGVATLTTRLLHSSGEWIEATSGCRLSKDDCQGYGSAISYLRRYSLAAMLGIVYGDEDDDGNEASRKDSQQPIQRLTTSAQPYRPVAPSKDQKSF